MGNEEKGPRPHWRCRGAGETGGVMGGAYGLAFIGALVYYIQHASTFGQGVIGFLKALVWPALLIYELMGYLQM